MAGRLLLLFLIVPLIETWVLIQVGSAIGVWSTIALVILTAIIGSQMARFQGLQTLREVQACQQRGELPAQPMIEGVILLIAGVVLALPGLITDMLGFLMLIPQIRKPVAKRVLRSTIVSQQGAGTYHQSSNSDNDSHTIEGRYRRDD